MNREKEKVSTTSYHKFASDNFRCIYILRVYKIVKNIKCLCSRNMIICPCIYIFFRVYKIVRNIRCVYRFAFFLFFFLSFYPFLAYRLAHALNSALSFSRRIIVFKYPLTYRHCLYTSRKTLVMSLSSRVITNGRGEAGRILHTPILHTNCSCERSQTCFDIFFFFFIRFRDTISRS